MIKTASQQQMKQTNTKAVYQLVRSHRSISRAVIAKMTKLSPTTISTIVDDLIAKGIVVERSLMESAGAGRKAIQLEISGSGKYLIGMEMSHHGVSGTLYNLRNEAISTITERYVTGLQAKDAVSETVVSVIRNLKESVDDRFHEPIGVCIGVPGVLDKEKRTIVFSSILPVENVELYDAVRREFAFPVFIENETLLAAMAERESMERKPSPFIYLSINEGLGASVILDNRHLKGVNGEMLEIGHMSLDPNGPECRCGNRGCFELKVSLPALDRIVRREMPNYPESVLCGYAAGNSVIASDSAAAVKRPDRTGSTGLDEHAVAEAAEAGDPLARHVVAEIGTSLGDGLVNLVNIFNPEMIVIGGRLSTLGEPMLEQVRKRVEARAIRVFVRQCEIALAGRRDSSISAGAGIYVLDKVLATQM